MRVCDYCCKKVLGEGDVDDTYDERNYYSISNQNTAGSALIQHWSNHSTRQSVNEHGDSPASPLPTSFDNIRKLFSHGSSILSSKIFGSGLTEDQEATEVPETNSLPFRNHISLDDETSVSEFEHASRQVDDSFVQFLFQQALQKSSSPTESERQLDDDSQLTIRSLNTRPRRGTFSNFKYSAHALRSQLSSSLQIDAPAASDEIRLGKATLPDPNSHNYLVNGMPSPIEATQLPYDCLSSTYKDFIVTLLSQTLREYGVGADKWMGVLLNLLIQTFNLENAVITRNSTNPWDRVHIKRIASGQPTSSWLCSGVAVTRNVMHKKMSRVVRNPKLLFISFPLEYSRVEQQFTSLEPVLNQERYKTMKRLLIVKGIHVTRDK